jgi:hypothetical protein
MLPSGRYENKRMPPAEHKTHRCATGEIDREIRARLLDGGTHGVVPLLDVRDWRRSPAEVSADAFTPTAAGVTVQAQYVPALLEAIASAAGLVVSVTPTEHHAKKAS